MKEYKKLIIEIIIGGIIASSITAYAYSYLASDVKYTNDTSVADALNDLYNKSANYILPSGTKTITTKENNIDVGEFKYVDTTGLYTLSEVQSGKGTHWNSGTFTSVSGENSIPVGFVPNKMLVIRSDSTAISYDNRISTTKFFAIYDYESTEKLRNISTSITAFGFRSIGSTTKVYIGGAGSTFYWFATE